MQWADSCTDKFDDGMAHLLEQTAHDPIAAFMDDQLEHAALPCLLDQPHANQAKYGGKTIAELAKAAGMTIVRFVHWELPKE